MTRIGPAGWAYKDWWGIVYPPKKSRDFHELSFLAKYFDTVEINVTFYRPLAAKTALAWLERIQEHPNFRFTAKLWRGFTHERTATTADEKEFKDGMMPLVEAERLGALLLQFPWSFRNTLENREYVVRLRDRFAEYPLVLEVRHASWSEPGILDFLEQLDLGLCNIDQPLFKRSVKPAALTTSLTGYIRLHGRNYKSWFTENKHPGERYDYLYSVEELDPWLDRIKAVEKQAKDTYVVTNNHYLGKGVVNALEISSILKGEPVIVPATLLERYPELREFTPEGAGAPAQLSFPTD
ncbi:MAG TPA: DUF72 domain-containing protein [Bryobacteraceae bacterium]|nr:DUF72 domain-containing protein [Bryobacteraceae bacterium]